MCFPERPAGNRARWPRQLGYPAGVRCRGRAALLRLARLPGGRLRLRLGGALGCFADREHPRAKSVGDILGGHVYLHAEHLAADAQDTVPGSSAGAGMGIAGAGRLGISIISIFDHGRRRHVRLRRGGRRPYSSQFSDAEK